MSDVEMEIDGHMIDVIPGPYVEDGQPTAAARAFALELLGRLDEMRVYAAKEMLDLYNDSWREEDDPVLAPPEFCARLTNAQITLYDEIGSAAVYFDTSKCSPTTQSRYGSATVSWRALRSWASNWTRSTARHAGDRSRSGAGAHAGGVQDGLIRRTAGMECADGPGTIPGPSAFFYTSLSQQPGKLQSKQVLL